MNQKNTLRLRLLAAAAVATAACLAHTATAQEMTITNARILDGTGRVIDRGSIVVRGGRIASVAAGAPAQSAGRVIDAAGKTVLPGYIDAHRHVVQGNGAEWLQKRAQAELQGFLDAGFTTVLGAIDPPELIEARKRIESGAMKGPRLLVGSIIPLAGQLPQPAAQAGAPTDPARTDPARRPLGSQAAPAIPREVTLKMIEDAKAAGYDYLKTVMNATPGGPEIETQKFIVAEGHKRGMPTITHAVSIRDTLATLEGKPDLLVHTPHIGDLGADNAALKKIVDANLPMTSTLQVFLPHFGPDGKPLFRDGAPFPFDTLSSAGQGPVNARHLWEAGLKNYGFGTDTQWPPKESLFDELRALSLVFSPSEIVSILTKNAAFATLKGNDIGTLEAGKLADIVIIDGDPLTRPVDLMNVVTTIKGGAVVFEKRP
ncbi:MAG: amidohydrolase family protein [Nevskiaceae bacterium]|jgi:imidazolonepropionase-like amidohydrolase|nr:amidohydrolase family protein [Nevskiaceae bacterium]